MLLPEALEAPSTDTVGKPEIPALPGGDASPPRMTEVLRVPGASPDEHRAEPRLQAVCLTWNKGTSGT